MTSPSTSPALEDEQEVDLSSGWQRLQARWWLPVGGLVVGAVVGIALALAGGSVWRAQTIVYLGQPFAPLGGGQIQSLATNPRTVGEIIRSEAALKAASELSGIPVSQAPLGDLDARARRGGAAPRHQPADRDRRQGLGEAEGRARRRRARPAGDRARLALRHREGRSSSSSRSHDSSAQLAEANARIRSAQAQQATVIADRSIPLDRDAAR